MRKIIFALVALAIASSSHADTFLTPFFVDGWGIITKLEEFNLAEKNPGAGKRSLGSTGDAVSQGVSAGGGGVAGVIVGMVVGAAGQLVVNAATPNKTYVPGVRMTIRTDDGQEVTREAQARQVKDAGLQEGTRVKFTYMGKTRWRATKSDKPLPQTAAKSTHEKTPVSASVPTQADPCVGNCAVTD